MHIKHIHQLTTHTHTIAMDQITHRFVQVNGLKLHVAEIGLESSPVVIFLHGFPEIWYTWRHQMIAVAKAGFRAIAPDFRGYGLSESPAEPEKATFADLIKDTASILDSLNISKVFVIGKDFGAIVTYPFALQHPEKVAGIVTIGLPFMPPGAFTTEFVLPEGFYPRRWQEPGRAEADFGRFDVKTVVRNVYILFSQSELQIANENQEIMDLVKPSTPLPSWFSEEDLEAYAALYEKSGFRTALQVPYRGLGFGSLRDANLSMLAKWWWRFTTEKDNLWRRVIWSIHHNNRSWAPIPAKVSVAGPWKQIVGIRDCLSRVGINLSESIWSRVGCGSKTAFWLDFWIGDSPLYIGFPLLFALESDRSCRVSDRVSWGIDVLNVSWAWSRSILSDSEQQELSDLLLLLCDFNGGEGLDTWVWKYDNSGVFSVASIKITAATESNPVPGYGFHWNKLVPKKVGIVSWRALSERLPTRVALAARNIQIADTRCLLCEEYDETSDHLFVACQFTQSIWLIVAQWCRSQPTFAFSLKDILEAHNAVHGSKKKKLVLNAIAQVVIWCVWRMRNEVLFGQASPSVSKVVEEVKSMAFLWIKNRAGSSNWSWNDWRSFSLNITMDMVGSEVQNPKVEVPTTMIMGEADYVLKIPGMGEYIRSGEVKKYVPNQETIYVPHGSHFLPEQFPEKVNELVLDFLNRHKHLVAV
ncbi:uncharacterized protein LOC110935680 [Helianthus annuus]|uniref:uncharacterized protein LOC110935680 n=1 Tax=Helianthus annuus TaxID=4232 RepID=UPI001652DB62|nr:uncharacterized protein LOC110935680 [Helianthus annuus]